MMSASAKIKKSNFKTIRYLPREESEPNLTAKVKYVCEYY